MTKKTIINVSEKANLIWSISKTLVEEYEEDEVLDVLETEMEMNKEQRLWRFESQRLKELRYKINY